MMEACGPDLQDGHTISAPSSSPAHASEQSSSMYSEELERCMLHLNPLAGVIGNVTATPLFAFVALLAQDVNGRLESLKETRKQVQTAIETGREGLLHMLDEERRSKAASGMSTSHEALTQSVATVTEMSMLRQLDAAVMTEMKALASWLVQIEGIGILAVVEARHQDGSEITSLAAQSEAEDASVAATSSTMLRLESMLGPLTSDSAIVQNAARTFISCCLSLSSLAKGKSKAEDETPPSHSLMHAAQSLAGLTGTKIEAVRQDSLATNMYFTPEELNLLMSCMTISMPLGAQ